MHHDVTRDCATNVYTEQFYTEERFETKPERKTPETRGLNEKPAPGSAGLFETPKDGYT